MTPQAVQPQNESNARERAGTCIPRYIRTGSRTKAVVVTSYCEAESIEVWLTILVTEFKAFSTLFDVLGGNAEIPV